MVLVLHRAICFHFTMNTQHRQTHTHTYTLCTDFIWIRNICPAHFLHNTVSDGERRESQRKGGQTANLLSTFNIPQTFFGSSFFLPLTCTFTYWNESILSLLCSSRQEITVVISLHISCFQKSKLRIS